MKRTLFLTSLLLLTSCTETKKSELLTEDGVVVQTILRPYHQHESVTPVVSTDAEGNATVTYETSIDTYWSQHWVVFACQHGEFAINDEKVWSKVWPGMRVRISYYELHHYKKQKKQLIHTGVDFQFVDAQPLQSEWNLSDVQVPKGR